MKSALPPLANPKPARSKGQGQSSWYRFYAMFSEQFAEEVLAAAGLPAGAVVLDPWLGVGTTTAVAARSGLRAIGMDINPAMVAIARGRCIDRAGAEAVIERAELASRRMRPAPIAKTDPLLGWFGPSAAGALREWHRLILSLFPQDEHPQQAGFLLTALFEAAWAMADTYRAKNPTWVKKPSPGDRADSTARDISNSVLTYSRSKVAGCYQAESAAPMICLGTSVRLDLPATHVDFVLTSPPYCTRIDYAVSTCIELAVLGYDDTAMAELRDATMGTSTIRQAGQPAEKLWGPICTDLLAQILLHSSKSSANYYHKTFAQYFADLYASMVELNRCLKPGAGAVIVVQDSRYKGSRIDLAGIVTEMATSMRWALVRRDDYDVAQTMRRINTRSRRYLAEATSVESVLWFIAPTGG
jgi:DNA modification methylase